MRTSAREVDRCDFWQAWLSIWALAVFFRNVGKARTGEIGGAVNVED